MHLDLSIGFGFLAEFNAQTALKLLIVALAYPLWGPIAKAMRHEVTEALAPGGGMLGTAPRRDSEIPEAGLDPFQSVPLASHRRKTQQMASQSGSGSRGRQGVLTPQPRANPAPNSRTQRARPSAPRKRSSF